MSVVLKLLLLGSVVVLQGSTQQWNNYADLPEEYRTHIDKALDEANKKLGGPFHIGYESLRTSPTITPTHWQVHVRLMVTECKKDRTKLHRDECAQRKPNTPWIDCLVCKKKGEEELIDCAKLADVKNRKDIREQCLYRRGGGSLLAQKSGNNETTFGCIGCV
uniref:Cystatin domain-containing protein n=1 Tax=Astyanax mexicanus TaxID=7994 RepID=A0A8B9RGW4_ASTMX